MDALSRETRISAAFVSISDTLTTEYDEIDLLDNLLRDCVEILGMEAGAIVLTDRDGKLHLIASTTASAKFTELMAVAGGEGPCIDCFTTGKAVSVSDLQEERATWPMFVAQASAEGYRAVLATPMALRGKVIGALAVFGNAVGDLSERDAALAQALADVATIGILQERLIAESQLMEEQLQRALESRVLVEQAKGIVATSLVVSMDEAFTLLRKYARDRNLTVRSVSQQLSDRELTVGDMVEAKTPELPTTNTAASAKV